jgi:hypothetical protein
MQWRQAIFLCSEWGDDEQHPFASLLLVWSKGASLQHKSFSKSFFTAREALVLHDSTASCIFA